MKPASEDVIEPHWLSNRPGSCRECVVKELARASATML